MFNILTEPLIQTRTAQGVSILSLPEVYSALMADDVDAFPALRPHQRHAWHAFLVQLGAMAMHRAGVKAPPRDPRQWTALIRGLTPDHPDDAPLAYGSGRHRGARLHAAAGPFRGPRARV